MLPSTFRQLEVFLAVVDADGMAGAAARLSVSTATVSNHVKALERQMGCALFERQRGRRLVLTEPGRRVLLRARELMRQAELLAQELQPNRPSVRPRLTVITQRFLARSFLSDPISAFTEQNPGIELVFETERMEAIMAKIADGAADLAYIIDNADRIEMPSRVVGRERLGFYAAPHHEAVGRMPLSVAALEEYPFYLTRADERFGHVVRVAMESFGMRRITAASQIQDGAMIGEIVSRGQGLMCGPAGFVERLVAEGRLVELEVETPPEPLYIHEIRVGRKSKPAAEAFSALLSG